MDNMDFKEATEEIEVAASWLRKTGAPKARLPRRRPSALRQRAARAPPRHERQPATSARLWQLRPPQTCASSHEVPISGHAVICWRTRASLHLSCARGG